ncbi:hypothetical protein AB751O23_AD_00080 [Chlamydiales bacterium SCGC AB-751-O23]|jgi:chaperonin GroEL|nr:hypothetical protein AB751O23_AD_00080 [Chlamydiales bacterium SCGC AB-751-O23]
MTSTDQDLLFFNEAREKILTGIERIVDLTAYTYGPMGSNIKVVSEHSTSYFSPRTSSIVQDIELVNKFEKLGEHFTKALIQKVDREFQDGSCLAILLLHALVKNGLDKLQKNQHADQICQEMKEGLEFLYKELDEKSFAIENESQLSQFISGLLPKNQNVGLLLNELFQEIGLEGDILIESCAATDHFAQILPGARIDSGYVSPYFCDSKEKDKATLDFPLLLLLDAPLNNIHSFLTLFKQLGKAKEQLIILAHDIEPNVLATLSINHLQGNFKICPLKGPKDPKKREALFQNLAKASGTTAFKDIKMLQSSNAIKQLGRLKKAIVYKEFSHFLFDDKSLSKSFESLEKLEISLEEETNLDKLQNIQESLSFINGYLGVLYTNSQGEALDQLFDCSRFISSALKHGVVTGGGLALYRAAQSLLESPLGKKAGVQVLARACSNPLTKLIENSGLDSPSLLKKIHSEKDDMGFNAKSGKIEDLRKKTIVDPKRLIKTVLKLSSEGAMDIFKIDALIC